MGGVARMPDGRIRSTFWVRVAASAVWRSRAAPSVPQSKLLLCLSLLFTKRTRTHKLPSAMDTSNRKQCAVTPTCKACQVRREQVFHIQASSPPGYPQPSDTAASWEELGLQRRREGKPRYKGARTLSRMVVQPFECDCMQPKATKEGAGLESWADHAVQTTLSPPPTRVQEFGRRRGSIEQCSNKAFAPASKHIRRCMGDWTRRNPLKASSLERATRRPIWLCLQFVAQRLSPNQGSRDILHRRPAAFYASVLRRDDGSRSQVLASFDDYLLSHSLSSACLPRTGHGLGLQFESRDVRGAPGPGTAVTLNWTLSSRAGYPISECRGQIVVTVDCQEAVQLARSLIERSHLQGSTTCERAGPVC